MSLKIGINGFGRIGRLVFRSAIKRSDIEIVAINDLLAIDHLAYLLKYDSVHGLFEGSIDISDNYLIVNGKKIKIFSERDPEKISWGDLETDIVAECTGIFTSLPISQIFSKADFGLFRAIKNKLCFFLGSFAIKL